MHEAGADFGRSALYSRIARASIPKLPGCASVAFQVPELYFLHVLLQYLNQSGGGTSENSAACVKWQQWKLKHTMQNSFPEAADSC